MRLAFLQADGWELRNAQVSNAQNPDTFWLPSQEERENLERGQAAKLVFEIDINLQAEDKRHIQAERMWVVVAERIDDCYIGILTNKPGTLREDVELQLCLGAEIPFKKEHVIDIDDPPENYVKAMLEPPVKTWPRN